MSYESDISIIVLVNPDSAVSADSLRTSMNSILAQDSFDPGAIRILASADADSGKLQENIGEVIDSEGAAQCTAVTLTDLPKAVSGSKYLFFMENGDTLGKGALGTLLKRAKAGKYSVVYLTDREWVKKNKSVFHSCSAAETDPQISVRGAMIRQDAISDLQTLLGRDHKAYEELDRTLIACRGYFLDYKGILNRGPIDDPILTPDAEKLRQVMEYTEKTFPGGMLYIEKFILHLIELNLQFNPQVGDFSSSLQLIRDDTILTVPGISIHERLHFLKIKYGKDIMEDAAVRDDGAVIWNGHHLFYVSSRRFRFRINIFDIMGDEIYISGTSDLDILGPGYRIFLIEENGNRTPVDMVPDHVRDMIWPNGDVIHEGKQYEVRIPLRAGSSFEFILEDKDERQIVLGPEMGLFSRMPNWQEDGYVVKNGYLISSYYGRFTVESNSAGKHFRAEWKYLRRLWADDKRRIIPYRLLHHLRRPFCRKPVWIVADRPHVAGDNGEHMFKYLMHSDAAKNHDIRFLIRKDSKDFERIRSIGPVLEYGSLKHRMKFMETSMVISAAANDLATSAFGKSQAYYRNLCDYDFVYLRHGVAKDDQSRFLNKQRKNIRVLLSTSSREHDAIIAGKYGYTEREVKLTGLPRFDNLYDERQKKISILPTWRKNLEGGRIEGSAEREYIVDFKDTDYYRFYQSLISDERLLEKMRELGYTGSFYLHPVFEEQIHDFKGNDVFEIGTTVADYQTLFRESSIMVTDFSSVAFDFAYLKKPLIYSQFDEDTFYQDHSWDRGYFTYREDGFGPITNTVEETVDALLHYMDNGCVMEDLYVQRVEEFFPFTDRNNCKRVYDVIMEAERTR